MGIDLVWLDGTDQQRDAVLDGSDTISAVIERVRDDRRQGHLLVSGIDPYGNTRFSSGQAPQLLREFEELRRASQDPEERIALGHLLSVLRAMEGITDEWLEFVGD